MTKKENTTKNNNDSILVLGLVLVLVLVLGLGLVLVLALALGLVLVLGLVLALGLVLGLVLALFLALDDERIFEYYLTGLLIGIIIGLVLIASHVVNVPTQNMQNTTITTTIQPLNLNCTQLSNYINTNISSNNQQAAQTYIQIAQAKGCIK